MAGWGAQCTGLTPIVGLAIALLPLLTGLIEQPAAPRPDQRLHCVAARSIAAPLGGPQDVTSPTGCCKAQDAVRHRLNTYDVVLHPSSFPLSSPSPHFPAFPTFPKPCPRRRPPMPPPLCQEAHLTSLDSRCLVERRVRRGQILTTPPGPMVPNTGHE